MDQGMCKLVFCMTNRSASHNVYDCSHMSTRTYYKIKFEDRMCKIVLVRLSLALPLSKRPGDVNADKVVMSWSQCFQVS